MSFRGDEMIQTGPCVFKNTKAVPLAFADILIYLPWAAFWKAKRMRRCCNCALSLEGEDLGYEMTAGPINKAKQAMLASYQCELSRHYP